MTIFLTIFQYFIQASVDVADKFLISSRKIRPLNYTFFTVVTGVLIVVAWPFVFFELPAKLIFLNIFAGVWFAFAYYIFYKALQDGEVSRVIPFVFGLLPVFDIALQSIFLSSGLKMNELAGISLLIPGALLISYREGKFFGRHIGMKILTAAMLSSYNILWHFSSQTGPVLNSLIWNRIGGAGILLLLLILPQARKNIFGFKEAKNKKQTSVLFLAKQAVGGANFIFLSFLLSVGPVAVVDSLQGFRYVFLFIAGMFLSKKYKHIIEEGTSKHVFQQKLFAVVLISIGTIILFV